MILKPKHIFIIQMANNSTVKEICSHHEKYLPHHIYKDLKKLVNYKYIKNDNGKYTRTKKGDLVI